MLLCVSAVRDYSKPRPKTWGALASVAPPVPMSLQVGLSSTEDI